MLLAYCVNINGEATVIQILDTVWEVKRIRWKILLGRNLQYCEVGLSNNRYFVFLMSGKFNLI